MKTTFDLEKLIDLEEGRYKTAVATIQRIRQISKTREYDEIKKSGNKLSVVALSEVLSGEVKIIGEEISKEEAEQIIKNMEEAERSAEEAYEEENAELDEEIEEIAAENAKAEKKRKARKKKTIDEE